MNTSAKAIGPSIWAVSDGRAGNAAQVRAIIAALSETRRWMQIGHINSEAHREEPLVLTPGAPWTWLPGASWPIPRLALPKAQRTALTGPWPTLWIAAGRRSAPYSAALRNWSGGRSFTVQILDPKTDPTKFDLVIVPEHDTLEGENVIRTIGSPTHFSPEALEETGQVFADLADERGKSVLIVLGGHSKAHRFTKRDSARLRAQFEALAASGWRLRVTTSRRTPIPIVAEMRALSQKIGARFWAGPQDGENPYLGWLLYSDVAIVTEDSSNMLCDAAWHGLPVHIARLSGSAPKFDRLHQSLIKRGVARWFEGDLEQWDYAPLREAGRVADSIIEKLIERFPQPDIPAFETDKTAAPDWV